MYVYVNSFSMSRSFKWYKDNIFHDVTIGYKGGNSAKLYHSIRCVSTIYVFSHTILIFLKRGCIIPWYKVKFELRVLMLPIFTISIFDFPTVWYFLLFKRGCTFYENKCLFFIIKSMTLSTLYFELHKNNKLFSVKPRCEKFGGTNHFTSKL